MEKVKCQHVWSIEYSPSSYLKLKARCVICDLVIEDCDCPGMTENIWTTDVSEKFYMILCKSCGKLKEVDDVVDELYDR